jgi:hypothetical protein
MKIQINIPETLDDITLRQYQSFNKFEEPTIDQTLTTFLGISIEQLNKLPAEKIEGYATQINSVFEQDKQFTPTFVLNGVKYGFIPKLDSITYGENKDLTTYLNDFDNMHKAMAVMYRPITYEQRGKYLIEDYEGSSKYSEVMKEAPLSVVLGATVFFYNLTNGLLKAIPNYLEEELEKESKDLLRSGEVTKNQLHSLMKSYKDLLG